jgi:hypothetical protein
MTAPVFFDRRTASQEMVVLIQQIHDNQMAMDAKLMHHMANETDELATAITKLMAKAFPAGDPDGHRRHHELVIRQAEERAEFWSKMRIALAQYGLLGFAGWAFWALWQAALQGPHK